MVASIIFGVLEGGLNVAGTILNRNAQESVLAEQEAQLNENSRKIKIVSAVAIAMLIVLLILLLKKKRK